MTVKRFPERRARTTRNGRLVFRGHEKSTGYDAGLNFWRTAVDAIAEKRGVSPESIISDCTAAVERFGDLAAEESKKLGKALTSVMLAGYLKSVNDAMMTDVAEPHRAQFVSDFHAAIDFVAAGFTECDAEIKAEEKKS